MPSVYIVDRVTWLDKSIFLFTRHLSTQHIRIFPNVKTACHSPEIHPDLSSAIIDL